MKLPQKISPCPVVEAVVEIRFEPCVPGDAVFGLLYTGIREDFPQSEAHPVLQIPEMIRDQDPMLRYTPHYKLLKDNFALQIGPRVLSISTVSGYPGWNSFTPMIKLILGKFFAANIAKNIERVGVRYINLFDLNIFQKMSIDFKSNDVDFRLNSSTVSSTVLNDKTISQLRISNEAKAIVDGKEMSGSIIDIDTYVLSPDYDEKNVFEKIEVCHVDEKNMFFSILLPEFIAEHAPEY
ncbi:MAG TPA: TIGR04255 family protein [Desulfovibrio sp.]|uniref:TIGR04255 family protein n=1 Tax=Desulfovibrio sp. TaxID=885 RepID=UPI002D711DB9|nr:TIGR04255 family protein [Desulfovibrio sp.]HZF61502.1 TIGR04255 family protein [Desulfovibrio sp.]